MKNEKIQDERIENEKIKIQSEAFQILVFCLLASVCVQQFIIHAPFSQFAAEFFCVIGAGIFVGIRNMYAGINTANSTPFSFKKIAVTSLISGIICTVIYAALTGETDYILLFFLIFTACYCIVQTVVQIINRKKQRQIIMELDKRETEN